MLCYVMLCSTSRGCILTNALYLEMAVAVVHVCMLHLADFVAKYSDFKCYDFAGLKLMVCCVSRMIWTAAMHPA